MKTLAILIILTFFSNQSSADVEKRCLQSGTIIAGKALISSNIDGFQSLNQLNKTLEPKTEIPTILVRDSNDGVDVQFVNYELQPNDCVLANTVEKRDLYIAADLRTRQSKTETFFESVLRFAGELKSIFDSRTLTTLQPVVLFRNSDGAKLFGYVLLQDYLLMTKQSHVETKTKDLIKHSNLNDDLTILYLVCPKERDEVCSLTIKHEGQWVNNGTLGKKRIFKVLARSSRLSGDPNTSYRVTSGGDTPQGIYYIWASMYTESLTFGGVPRIDIEASQMPINAMPYNLNSYVLQQLAPDSALNDYWINEYALAYKLGRNNLRLHDDSTDPTKPKTYTTPKTGLSFHPTIGCVNLGDQMTKLLDLLVKLKVFKKEDLEKGVNNAATLGWRVNPKLGKVFLVVKDLETN